MSDSLFVEYLNDFIAQEKILLKIHLKEKHYPCMNDCVKCSLVVHNESQFNLPKDTYFVMVHINTYNDFARKWVVQSYHKLSDRDINKGETVVFPFSYHLPGKTIILSSKFFIKKLNMSELQMFYKPTGYEYSEYIQVSDKEKREIVDYNNNYYSILPFEQVFYY